MITLGLIGLMALAFVVMHLTNDMDNSDGIKRLRSAQKQIGTMGLECPACNTFKLVLDKNGFYECKSCGELADINLRSFPRPRGTLLSPGPGRKTNG